MARTCWSLVLFGALASCSDSDGATPGDGDEPVRSVAQAITDTDIDGLDDGWETTHFGNLSQTATGDFDSDAMTNLEEYTHSFNPTMFLGVQSNFSARRHAFSRFRSPARTDSGRTRRSDHASSSKRRPSPDRRSISPRLAGSPSTAFSPRAATASRRSTKERRASLARIDVDALVAYLRANEPLSPPAWPNPRHP